MRSNTLLSNTFSAESIRNMALSFQTSRILLTAYELGLFTALGDQSKTAGQVAKMSKINARAAERLMNALCTIGLLKKSKGKFSNTPISSKFLVKDKPDFMKGLGYTVNMWNTWSTLTEAVRKGSSVLESDFNKRKDTWFEAFIAAMHERARKQAPAVVELLDLSCVSRLLDVGGGSGIFSMAFVRANKNIKATVFDLPSVIALTKRYLKEEGLLDKIDTVKGDYNIDDLGMGFDLVFLSAIVHSNSVDENIKLIEKCVKALNPGGQLVVQDFIMDEGRTTPAFGALFSLNMLVATESGDTYTESEVRLWMKEAGLSKIIRKDTDFDTALIVGRKVK